LRYLQIVEGLRDEFSSQVPVLQIDWTGIEDVTYLPALLESFASGIWSIFVGTWLKPAEAAAN
jgi:hypothetical protein